MNILVVNDDGYESEGLIRLAAMARPYGKVTVVAPVHPCSAMSHTITIRKEMTLEKREFPVPGVEAYTLTGTPADCVKAGIHYVMRKKPDYVFSGINNGYNTGYDTVYSGTVAAALEAVMNGVKAVAFSKTFGDQYYITDTYLPQVIKKLLTLRTDDHSCVNVNIPECAQTAFKGVLWDRVVAPFQIFTDRFINLRMDGNVEIIKEDGVMRNFDGIDTQTDIGAVMNGYISVGTIKSNVLS